MAVPATVAAPAIAAAVDGFKDVTSGAFQTLATMNLNNNKRKVLIQQIKADVRKYLADLDLNLQKSMKSMDIFHAMYEKQLDDSNLTFDEKRELLNDFSNIMFKIIGC